jgi:tripartite-type tricarboxylate transporter receptor subunit TctC
MTFWFALYTARLLGNQVMAAILGSKCAGVEQRRGEIPGGESCEEVFMLRLLSAVALTLCGLMHVFSAVHAQSFPAKSVRLIVPWPPGGSADIVGRLLAMELQSRWGQAIVIENRGGASGNIGMELAARSPADGYTFVLALPPQVSTPFLQKLPYDLLKDLAPVAQLAVIEYIFAANPNAGVATLDDLIAQAKADPKKFNFGSAGNGSGQHLQVELLKAATGMSLTHVPYKGAAPALQALMAGEVQLMFDASVGILPLVRAGKLRPLLVTGTKPMESLPGVPALGVRFPDMHIEAWHGLMTPAGTPKAIIDKVSADVRAIVLSPAVASKFRDLGFQPTGTTPEQFGEVIRRDLTKWAKIIRENNLRAD